MHDPTLFRENYIVHPSRIRTAFGQMAFQSFSKLPPELRVKIWHASLPIIDHGAVFFYRKEGWAPEVLSESDPRHLGRGPEMTFGFRPELLDKVAVKTHMPLAAVNREARRVAIEWVHRQDVKEDFHKDFHCHTFSRSFDPARDILYMGLWMDAYGECMDRIFEPDVVNRNIDTDIFYAPVAMPLALLFTEWEVIGDLILEWFRPAVIYLVVDIPPHLHLHLQVDQMRIQRRWELRERGRAFVWNWYHHRFELRDGESIEPEPFYERIGDMLGKLTEKFAGEGIRNLKVQPAFVVKT